MKKNSSVLSNIWVLSLCLSMGSGGWAFAQTTETKPGKGGSLAVPSTVTTAPIQLPAAPPPVVEQPAPAAPPVAVPAVTDTAPANNLLPTNSQVGGVSTEVKPGGKSKAVKARKAPKKQQERKKVTKKPAKKAPAKGKQTRKSDAVKPAAKKSVPAKKAAPAKRKAVAKKPVVQPKKATASTKKSSAPRVGNSGPSTNALAPEATEASVGSTGPIEEIAPLEPVKVNAVAVPATTALAPETAAKPITAPVSDANTAPTTGPGSCEDVALKKIYDLMLHDQSNTVGIMFELTAMRLAKRSLEQMPKATTFEELTQGNIKALEKRLNGIQSSSEIQKQVKDIYETYGKKSDLSIISRDFNQMMKKNQNACYFSKHQRFQNDEASAYILAVSVGEKDSGLSDIDAATVWVVERARAEAEKTDPEHYAIGKDNGNLLNMSTRVSRYLGRIEDGKNATPEVMVDLIAEEEKKLVGVLAGAYLQVKVALKACLLKETNNCEKCTVTRMESFEKSNEDIDQIQRGLLSTVAKSDNLKIEKDLKGRMGDVVYDFSNFAKKGENDVIPPNPPRGKYDACGHLIKASHAPKAPSRAPSNQESKEAAPAQTE